MQRELYGWLLRRYASGDRPTTAQVSARAASLGLAGPDALQAIADHDLLTLGPNGELKHIYPFSGSPTPHAVWLTSSSRAVYAMCALDALGMPFMLGQAATIRSRDLASGEAIEAAVHPDGDRQAGTRNRQSCSSAPPRNLAL